MKQYMIKRVKELGANALIASQEFRDYVEKFESEINRGISTIIILSIIKQAGDKGIHGYGILKELQEQTNETLVIEEGTLYPLLRKLEKTDKKKRPKILVSWRDEVEGRMRKVYKMTETGEKIYNHLMGFFSKLIEAISPLLDLKVHLEEDFIFCPNCANRINFSDEEIQFCEICGYPIQELRKRRLE
jgi:PadR family transcriptional regulator, regulatory protein PadR